MSICIHGNLCREIYKKTGYINSQTCPSNCKYFEEKKELKNGTPTIIERDNKEYKKRERNKNDKGRSNRRSKKLRELS